MVPVCLSFSLRNHSFLLTVVFVLLYFFSPIFNLLLGLTLLTTAGDPGCLLPTGQQEVPGSLTIALTGCQNPWQYRILKSTSLGDGVCVPTLYCAVYLVGPQVSHLGSGSKDSQQLTSSHAVTE